jgi:hypothetical protein
MLYKSTNSEHRFTHFGGALVIGHEFGSGIELNPTSSGADPNIMPAGDESAKNLRLQGKGTGGVVFGASSTRTVKGVFSQNSTFSHAGIAAARQIEVTFASTTVDIMPGDLLTIGYTADTANFSSVVTVAAFRLSATDSSRLTVTFGNQSSTATSTGSGTLALAWIDLT